MKSLIKKSTPKPVTFNDFQKVALPKKQLVKVKGGESDYIGVEDVLIV